MRVFDTLSELKEYTNLNLAYIVQGTSMDTTAVVKSKEEGEMPVVMGLRDVVDHLDPGLVRGLRLNDTFIS